MRTLIHGIQQISYGYSLFRSITFGLTSTGRVKHKERLPRAAQPSPPGEPYPPVSGSLARKSSNFRKGIGPGNVGSLGREGGDGGCSPNQITDTLAGLGITEKAYLNRDHGAGAIETFCESNTRPTIRHHPPRGRRNVVIRRSSKKGVARCRLPPIGAGAHSAPGSRSRLAQFECCCGCVRCIESRRATVRGAPLD
ncbi:hypothetical protein GWI33_012736 [Rhynchophorus ferrugineus]|uniref:Uncharacterized protein n=1 Tax=Rhynchophorus ferrugineus TaxID=354439 RepID=A0A834M7A2_RHYFE|nr:hypothetical protein GWI33_012736 [Rhynchophorus ferrugineus]